MNTSPRLSIPPSARLVNAFGVESDVSLNDEVSDMPPERRADFAADLDRLYRAEVELILSEGDVLL